MGYNLTNRVDYDKAFEFWKLNPNHTLEQVAERFNASESQISTAFRKRVSTLRYEPVEVATEFIVTEEREQEITALKHFIALRNGEGILADIAKTRLQQIDANYSKENKPSSL